MRARNLKLLAQPVGGIHFEGAAVADDGDDDGQAHGRFGGGDHEDEEVAVELMQSVAEGDEGQIHAVEHQLDGYEDGDEVALEQEAGDAKAEEDRAQGQVIGKGNHVHLAPAALALGRASSRRAASTTAPSTPTRNRTEVTSKGSR